MLSRVYIVTNVKKTLPQYALQDKKHTYERVKLSVHWGIFMRKTTW